MENSEASFGTASPFRYIIYIYLYVTRFSRQTSPLLAGGRLRTDET